MSETQPLEIFAWVSPDRTGNVGIMTIITPIGQAPAAFQGEDHANFDWVREQVQYRANELGVTVNLLHLKGDAEVRDSISSTSKAN